MIALIAAMAKNRVIGKNNRLPWRLPADLSYFKSVTLGHPILMGRKTFEAIGRPLPGRINLVVTRNRRFRAEGCEVFHSLEEALERWKSRDIFVIGGAEIFKQTLNLADRLYLTYIDQPFEGDAFFPEFNPDDWRLLTRRKGIKDEKNPYDYEYLIYERNSHRH